MTIDDNLRSLLAELPEVYQPIYGHLELGASRSSDSPRMAALQSIVAAIAESAGRPLQILDLGSAQGFTSLMLAEHGHRVVGLEMLPANVAVARCLALENPLLNVEFVLGDVLDVPELVDLATFDLVLGFSVLHHLAYRDGHAATVRLVERIARAIPHGVYEMARSSEPLYWAASLPTDPRVTLDTYSYVRQIAESPTHLSAVTRPTLYCSTSHVVVRNRLVAIESFTRRSHALVGDAQTRLMRYLGVDGGIVKVAASFADDVPLHVLQTLRTDLRREARVLEFLERAGVESPQLIEFFDGADETSLARTTYPGHLLSEVVASCTDDELRLVTGDVLDQLAALQQVGLYHSDLRLWNVVFDRADGRARLIDHGAVREHPDDVVWPRDPYFSWIAFLAALWIWKGDRTGAELPRSAGLDQPGLPSDVARLVTAVLVHERDNQVFADAARMWRAPQPAPAGSAAQEPLAWGFIVALERQRDSYLVARDAGREVAERRHERELATLEVRLEELLAENERLAAQLAGGRRDDVSALEDRHRLERLVLEGRLAAADEAYRSLVAAGFGTQNEDRERRSEDVERVEGLQRQVEQLAAELEAMRATVSWRVTKPVRSIRRRVPRSG